jgi:hypothetical protein
MNRSCEGFNFFSFSEPSNKSVTSGPSPSSSSTEGFGGFVFAPLSHVPQTQEASQIPPINCSLCDEKKIQKGYMWYVGSTATAAFSVPWELNSVPPSAFCLCDSCYQNWEQSLLTPEQMRKLLQIMKPSVKPFSSDGYSIIPY